MKCITMKYDWLNNLLPQGLPYPSSTLISDPRGTGKPLVEFAFVSSWLKAGGSAIGIPLQYPTVEFVRTAMNISGEETEVPISRDLLLEIKDVAEATRKRIIPLVMRI